MTEEHEASLDNLNPHARYNVLWTRRPNSEKRRWRIFATFYTETAAADLRERLELHQHLHLTPTDYTIENMSGAEVISSLIQHQTEDTEQ